jgi:hypothetical protein
MIMSQTWDQMLPEYKGDVNKKVRDLAPLAESIREDVGLLIEGSMMSSSFRLKGLDRIAEKDLKDYGRRSKKTQVKDIYAGRIAPGRLVKDKSESEIKTEIKDKILEFYDGRNDVEITVDNKQVPVSNGTETRVINIQYVIFNKHIELQILTLEEYLFIEQAHDEYEESRVDPAAYAMKKGKVYLMDTCTCNMITHHSVRDDSD